MPLDLNCSPFRTYRTQFKSFNGTMGGFPSWLGETFNCLLSFKSFKLLSTKTYSLSKRPALQRHHYGQTKQCDVVSTDKRGFKTVVKGFETPQSNEKTFCDCSWFSTMSGGEKDAQNKTERESERA